MPSLNAPAGMFSEKNSDIIDAYNDNCRRYFESILAKKILMSMIVKPAALKELITDLTGFLKTEYTLANYTKYLSQWQKAKGGTPPGRDALDFFAELRKDLIILIEEKHFTGQWKKNRRGNWEEGGSDLEKKQGSIKNNLLIDLYDLHYLTHGIYPTRMNFRINSH
jgi:hypothetical protein